MPKLVPDPNAEKIHHGYVIKYSRGLRQSEMNMGDAILMFLF